MPYTYNASDNSSLMKEGDYEATIERMERKTLPSGKEKLSIMYRIRSDVEQPYKNRCMFEDIWESKEEVGVFNRKRINQLLGTQEVEDGQEFETINDVIKFMIGCDLVIHIAIELDTYREEDVNTVSYYKSTKYKPLKIGETGEAKQEPQPTPVPFAAEPKKSQDAIGLVEDDLPF